MSNSSLVDVVVKAHSGNYTAGRGGYKINHITIHHMAGVLTAAQCGSIFAKAGRNGSANYGVGSDGKVGLYVNESDRAWADSNWQSNCTTVSIETSNSSTGGNWPVSARTFDKLVLLVADIAKRNGLGKLVPGKNLCWHSMYTATACPGDYLRGKMQELANRANAINYPPKPVEPTAPTWKDIKAATYETTKEANLYNVVSGSIISTYKKGTGIGIVQTTTWKGVEYGRTEWSRDHKLNNGFKMSEMAIPQPKPEPEPKPEPKPEPTPTPTPEPEDPTVGILQKIIDFIKHIIDLITKKEK